ncbi:hypothetical protein FV219_20765, partial [Methylobacterium sp. WL122]
DRGGADPRVRLAGRLPAGRDACDALLDAGEDQPHVEAGEVRQLGAGGQVQQRRPRSLDALCAQRPVDAPLVEGALGLDQGFGFPEPGRHLRWRRGGDAGRAPEVGPGGQALGGLGFDLGQDLVRSRGLGHLGVEALAVGGVLGVDPDPSRRDREERREERMDRRERMGR